MQINKLLVAFNGAVFDVTESETFQKGAYHNYPGHDITIAVAKHSLSSEFLDVQGV